VFQHKITDPERILATLLYQRRVCTRQALAELFDVSPRTIGTACSKSARSWNKITTCRYPFLHRRCAPRLRPADRSTERRATAVLILYGSTTRRT